QRQAAERDQGDEPQRIAQSGHGGWLYSIALPTTTNLPPRDRGPAMTVARPIAVYHEHPDWFRPLFAELDRRGVQYVRLDPRGHRYDPAEPDSPYALVFNRMSPSAYLRGGGQAMFYTHAWLAHLERLGVPVVNGARAWRHE